jgi:hypothetical protein
MGDGSVRARNSSRRPSLLRLTFLGLAIAGMAFSLIDYPRALQRQASRSTYRQLMAGETLPLEFLRRRTAAPETAGASACDNHALLALALAEARLAESTLASGEFNAHLTRAGARAEAQILCTPHDGFAWFIAFWHKVLQGELVDGAWRYLDQSYRLAPNEAWVALIRLPLAASLWEIMSEERRRFVLNDFELLARGGHIQQCARLYAISQPPLRESFATRLATLDEYKKRSFNYFLRPYPVDPIMTRGDMEKLKTYPNIPLK